MLLLPLLFLLLLVAIVVVFDGIGMVLLLGVASFDRKRVYDRQRRIPSEVDVAATEHAGQPGGLRLLRALNNRIITRNA